MNVGYNKVYSSLVQDDADIVGLIAYGLYKNEKRQQIINFKVRNSNKNPNKSQKEQIENLLSSRLEYYQEKANKLLDKTVEQLIKENKDTIYTTYFKSHEYSQLELKINVIEKNTTPKSLLSELKVEILGNLAWLIILVIFSILIYFYNGDLKTLKQKAVNLITETENQRDTTETN